MNEYITSKRKEATVHGESTNVRSLAREESIYGEQVQYLLLREHGICTRIIALNPMKA